MTAALFIWALVFGQGQPHEQRGLASTFFPHERLNNGRLACDASRRWTDPAEPVCASRTIPCGTWVEVTYRASSTRCHVLDTGPWGALMPDGRWVIKRPGDLATAGAVYRGVIDVGPAVARAIGLPGMGVVHLRWWSRRLPRRRASSRPAS